MRRRLVVVRGGGEAAPVLAWLRQLLPAAMLLVTPAAAPDLPADGADAIVVDAEEVDSPMALADALAKGHARVADD